MYILVSCIRFGTCCVFTKSCTEGTPMITLDNEVSFMYICLTLKAIGSFRLVNVKCFMHVVFGLYFLKRPQAIGLDRPQGPEQSFITCLTIC